MGRGVGLGPGRGPGRGMGRGSLCGSSGIMSCRYLPFARLLAAHLPRICGAVDTRCLCQHLNQY